MKRFLLDENLLICTEKDGSFYHKVGQKAKDIIEEGCEGIIGQKCKVYYIGQEEVLRTDDFREPARYNHDLKYSEYSQVAMHCGTEIGRDFQFAGMRGNKPTPPYQDRKDLDNWKNCVAEKVSKGIPYRDVIGTSLMPPKSAADIQIKNFAERNKMVIVSADSDSWLESRGESDRLLIDHPPCYAEADRYAKALADAVLAKMRFLWK